MAIAHDIVAIRSAREILLIGPRLTLAAAPKREFLGDSLVRSKLYAAMSDPGDSDQLRRGLELWGLDTQDLKRTGNWALCDFVADLVGAGRLRALIAPDIDTQIAPTQRPPAGSAELAALLANSQLTKMAGRMFGGATLTPQMLAGVAASSLGQKLAQLMPQAPKLTPAELATLASSPGMKAMADKLPAVLGGGAGKPGAAAMTPEELVSSPGMQALASKLPAGLGSGEAAKPGVATISPEALATLASSEMVQRLAATMAGSAGAGALTSNNLVAALNSPFGKKYFKSMMPTSYVTAEGMAALAASPVMQAIFKNAAATSATPATKPTLDVAAMDLEERLMIVLGRTVESDKLSDAAKAELKAFLDPATIGMTVAVLAVWAASHLTPFGYIADALMLGVGVFFAGREAIEGGKKIAKFLGLTMSAKTEADLDLAADMLAAAIALLSVKLFAKLLTRGAGGLNSAVKGKKVKAEPPRPRDPEKRVAATPPPKSNPPPVAKPPSKSDPYVRPPPASMTNVQAREWYHKELDRIPTIDKSLPMEQQAKLAHSFRNEAKLAARDAMSDRDLANKLNRELPPASWSEIVNKYKEQGYKGDDLYKRILEGSETSNSTVDKALNLARKK